MNLREMIGEVNIAMGRYWRKPWSLVDGCTPVSEGCEHCWSAALAQRFRGGWDGTIHCREDRLDQPASVKKPTVFAVWNDLFHEGVDNRFIGRALSRMYDAKRHIFLVLTKRPKRMLDDINAVVKNFGMAENIWLGVTAENQERANERIPLLIQTPAAVSAATFSAAVPLPPVKAFQIFFLTTSGGSMVNMLVSGCEALIFPPAASPGRKRQ